MTIDSIGDIEGTVQEMADLSRSLERQVLINFNASNLPGSDFAGVTVHKGKFDAERAARLQLFGRRPDRQLL